MCNECKKECVGITPCGNCAVMEEKGDKIKCSDIITALGIVVVAYLWAIAG